MEQWRLIVFFVAIAAALYGYIHYGREIPKKTLRPRTTTWLIWGVLSTCVAIVQLRHGAGLGSIGAIKKYQILMFKKLKKLNTL